MYRITEAELPLFLLSYLESVFFFLSRELFFEYRAASRLAVSEAWKKGLAVEVQELLESPRSSSQPSLSGTSYLFAQIA